VAELKSCLPPSPSPEIRTWLESGLALEMAPFKLQQLNKINILLAHKPWMINKQHIQANINF
jgi:hypothetical protein